jgi:hypothetical protein
MRYVKTKIGIDGLTFSVFFKQTFPDRVVVCRGGTWQIAELCDQSQACTYPSGSLNFLELEC